MQNYKIYTSIAGAVLFIVVCLQNLEPVSFHFLFWTVASVSKFYLITGCIVIGAIVGFSGGYALFNSAEKTNNSYGDN